MADPKLHKLIMKYGIEGYGLYFACVELIAGNLSSDHVTFELEHDAELLAHIFKMDSRRVEDIMKEAIGLGLFEYNATTERIVCRKLAKRLDNTMSQNKEIQAILASPQFQETLRNFKLLKADKIRIDEKRIDKNIREDTTPDSAESDAPPPLSPKQEKEKQLGTEAKECLDYYFQKHKEIREFEPMIDGPRDMAIFKRLLADYSVKAIKQVTDFFFNYKGRSRFTTRALYSSFDTLYGVMLDKKKGKRK